MIKDIQKQRDLRNIPIQKVGVKGVEIPLKIQRKSKDGPETVYAKADMSVDLPACFKGTHMSRFVEILNDFRKENIFVDDLENILLEMKKKLDAKEASLKFSFKYFIEKLAPVSKRSSLMCYDCAFSGKINDGDEYKFFIEVKVPFTTLCPCSKEISRFGAHNQRATVKLKINYDKNNLIWLEDLIKDVESCASAEIYPLLKREDEKFVTEKAYENPKFVEDILRDVVQIMENNKTINYYEVEVEAFESIHNHNAFAFQKKS